MYYILIIFFGIIYITFTYNIAIIISYIKRINIFVINLLIKIISHIIPGIVLVIYLVWLNITQIRSTEYLIQQIKIGYIEIVILMFMVYITDSSHKINTV